MQENFFSGGKRPGIAGDFKAGPASTRRTHQAARSRPLPAKARLVVNGSHRAVVFGRRAQHGLHRDRRGRLRLLLGRRRRLLGCPLERRSTEQGAPSHGTSP